MIYKERTWRKVLIHRLIQKGMGTCTWSLQQGFSLGVLIFGDEVFFVMGPVLDIVGWLAQSLTSIHFSTITTKIVITKNVSRHYQMSPGGQNQSWLRAIGL